MAAEEDEKTPSPAQPDAEGRVVVVPPGGSKSAFQAFFDEHKPYVMGLLMAKKDMVPASAEDLCISVFATVDRVMKREEVEHPKALLARIADNKVRTHRRKGKLPVDRSHDPREMASREANPEEAVGIAQRRRLLAVHLEKMPPDAAELIQFLDIIGMSHADVAEIRKVPLNTVAIQHARAVAKLKQLVQAAEEGRGG